MFFLQHYFAAWKWILKNHSIFGLNVLLPTLKLGLIDARTFCYIIATQGTWETRDLLYHLTQLNVQTIYK